MLELERLDADLFRAQDRSGSPGVRLYGGQVAAQALCAAANTVVAGQEPHSLHGYFLRPGQSRQPVIFHVESTRDGRSFATRVVRATQDGETIFTLTASFHAPESGVDATFVEPASLDRNLTAMIPGQPDWPEGTPSPPGAGPRLPLRLATAVEGFAVAPLASDEAAGNTPFRAWVRAQGSVADIPVGPTALLTYVSDLAAMPAMIGLATGGEAPGMAASLDHSVWFHRPFRPDDWLLIESRPISLSGARGLALGSVWTTDGVLVASLIQEALIRRQRPSDHAG